MIARTRSKWGLEDRMIWLDSESRKFLVKAFYSFLVLGGLEPFPDDVV